MQQEELFNYNLEELKASVKRVADEQKKLQALLNSPAGTHHQMLQDVFAKHNDLIGFGVTYHPVPYDDENVYPDLGGSYLPPAIFWQKDGEIVKSQQGWSRIWDVSPPKAIEDAALEAQEIFSLLSDAGWVASPDSEGHDGEVILVPKNDTARFYGRYLEDREPYEGDDPLLQAIITLLNENDETMVYHV